MAKSVLTTVFDYKKNPTTTNNMDDFLNNESKKCLFRCKSRVTQRCSATSSLLILVAGSEDVSSGTFGLLWDRDVQTAELRAPHILIALLEANLLTQEDSSEKGCLKVASLAESQRHICGDCLQDFYLVSKSADQDQGKKRNQCSNSVWHQSKCRTGPVWTLSASAVHHRNGVPFRQERLKVSPQNCDDEGHVSGCWYSGLDRVSSKGRLTGTSQDTHIHSHTQLVRVAPVQLRKSQHEYKYLWSSRNMLFFELKNNCF